MKFAYTIIGTVLIIAAVRDLFHALFHPVDQGAVGDWISHRVWHLFRKNFTDHLTLAGPVAFVLVVVYWSVSIIVGFALIYFPQLPQSFTFTQGLNPLSYKSFLGAVDVSLGALISLSTGTISTNLVMQFFKGVEAILGLVLLSASVSWILSIYPVLEHRRSLAHQASLLHFSEASNFRRLDELSDSELLNIFLPLTEQLTTSRNELTQFPITYYFRENQDQSSLAGILPYMADIAERFLARKGAAGLAAFTLGGAIDDYLKIVAKSHLRCPFTNRDEVLRALAKDHDREMVRAPESRPRAA